MKSTDKPATPPKTPQWVNRVVSTTLRSPLSRMLDRGILLMTVTGRRTGRSYTFPVQYVDDGDSLWIISGGGPEKTWWRNLVGGGPVRVLLRRAHRDGYATAHTYASDPTMVTEGLRRYVARFPGMARRLAIRPGDEESLARAAEQTVIVRVALSAGARDERPTSTARPTAAARQR